MVATVVRRIMGIVVLAMCLTVSTTSACNYCNVSQGLVGCASMDADGFALCRVECWGTQCQCRAYGACIIADELERAQPAWMRLSRLPQSTTGSVRKRLATSVCFFALSPTVDAVLFNAEQTNRKAVGTYRLLGVQGSLDLLIRESGMPSNEFGSDASSLMLGRLGYGDPLLSGDEERAEMYASIGDDGVHLALDHASSRSGISEVAWAIVGQGEVMIVRRVVAGVPHALVVSAAVEMADDSEALLAAHSAALNEASTYSGQRALPLSQIHIPRSNVSRTWGSIKTFYR